jgi:hypothetical protein
MKTQNISLIRQDIISKLQSTDDYSVMERIMKLLTQSEKKNKVLKFPTMTENEIIEQALRAEEEIKLGKTISNEQAYLQFKQWK